ncbi:helix-turn-helix domain-containing protein [Amycolatopsis sp. NPDC059021]|uniref:helix-turn-helix domain-containing protein n=1 Tax=Amycolatopsis sp. NPDC059021 TaxID=3346704 RepID=UPI003673214F
MGKDNSGGGVGPRVAEARKLAGLTQRQLAARAHVSLGIVRKVEQGEAPASPSFIAATAQALHLLVTDLTKPDSFAAATGRYDTGQALVPELERAIIEFEDPLITTRPVSPEDTSDLLNKVVAAGRLSHYAEALTVLPDLLRNLHALTTTVSGQADREHVYRLLAQAYQCAMFAAYKMGNVSLSSWAAERMGWAGARSGDPLWSAMGEYCRAQTMMFSGIFRSSEAVLNRASTELQSSSDTRAIEIRGAMHLSSAINAARLSRAGDADMHLAEARDLARHALPGDNFDTSFSMANVEIHSVAAAVEMSDGQTALERGADLDLKGKLYTSRIGHYHIDLARAWFLHGDYTRSLNEIQQARSIAPQQTRYHPQVHETIRAIARVRRRSEPVTRLAVWAGLRLNDM